MASIVHIIRRRKARRARRRERSARAQFMLAGLLGAGLLLVIVPAVIVFGGAVSAYARAVTLLAAPRQAVQQSPLVGASSLYDSAGSTLLVAAADSAGDTPAWVPLDALPEALIAATLLVEDPDYLTAPRLSLTDALALLWANTFGTPPQPDATLTGRLVRSVLARQPETITADDYALEIALVAEVNRRYTPQDVLEWHLNTNFYGGRAYGIESAAMLYLGKSAVNLTLDEAALLASIPTAPQYNPVDDPDAARSRQNDVLQRLLATGAITQREFEQAANTVTALRLDAGEAPLIAPDFARYARRQAEAILDTLGRDGAALVSGGGLRIITTLDLDLYYQMECLLRYRLEQLSGRDAALVRAEDGQACISAQFLPAAQLTAPTEDTLPPNTGILVVLDVATGEIRALVGAAADAEYQPGPALHPFIYLDAFTNLGGANTGQLFTPATMVLDIPREFPGAQDGLLYIPSNADGRFLGPLNLRDAMAAGRLLPVIQVANARGLNRALRSTAAPMGINTLTDGAYALTLLERGGAVSVLDVAYAYSVFASQGNMTGRIVRQTNPSLRQHDPVAVRRIEDAGGNVLWAYGPDTAAANRIPLLEEELPYIVSDILSDRTTRQRVSGAVVSIERPAAVVDGLTGDRAENWAVGYTPQVVAAVHLSRYGDEDGDDRFGLALSPYGLEGAAAVWQAAMEYAHRRDNLPVLEWERPEGIVEAVVCDLSGLLPTEACGENRRTEIFPAGFVPRTPDSYWQIVEVNSQNPRLRATANTDPALKRSEVFFVPPPEALDWWRANNRPLPPEQFDNFSRPDDFQLTEITQPGAYAFVGGQVEIRGTVNTTNLQAYQLSVGAGLNPAEWTDIVPPQTTYDPSQPLALWDTAGLDGLYALRLTTTLADSSIETSIVYVTVDNVPPGVVFLSPARDQTFRWPSDGVIPIRVQAQDNIRVSRVVFYHYGQEIGVREDCATQPEACGFDFPLTRTGAEVFLVEVFDAVGNSSPAEISVQVVRDG